MLTCYVIGCIACFHTSARVNLSAGLVIHEVVDKFWEGVGLGIKNS